MILDLYFIRHAETEVNIATERIGGRSNWAELTKNGITQARVLGKRLKSEGVYFKAIYSSPAIRTQQTARYTLESMGCSFQNIQLETSIIELSQGDWEGKIRKKVYSKPEVAKELNHNNWNFIPGDVLKGESQNFVGKRMENWSKEIIERHAFGKVGIFSHGLAIKFLLTTLFGFDKKTAFKIPIDNTSITIIRYNKSSIQLITQNDCAHLDKAGIEK